MKRIKNAGMIWIMAAVPYIVYSQQDSVLRLSLAEAREYALKNSISLVNAQRDLEAAKKKVWETTAIGLPQISAKAGYSYMITTPSTLEKFGDMFSVPFTGINNGLKGLSKVDSIILNNLALLKNSNDPLLKGLGNGFEQTAQYLEQQKSQTPSGGGESGFDIDKMRNSYSVDLTVSQLIFSGAYLVGLQTTKVLRDMSELSVEKMREEVTENITNTYFMALVFRRNKEIVDSSVASMEKILGDMRILNKKGFMDEIDADQFSITVSNIKNASLMIGRQYESFLRLLKFQAGIDMFQPVEISENLDSLIEIIHWTGLIAETFMAENTTEYQLLEKTEKMAQLAVKQSKSAYLPDLAAVYMHHEEFNKSAFSFTPPDLVAVSMNIPIFSSGSRNAKLSQAKINYEKAKSSRWQATQALIMQYEEAKSSLLNTLDNYQTQKENLKLAERILNRAFVRYQQGTISGMELSQTQNQFFNAQIEYFKSLMQLMSAYNKVSRMLNKF